jgi:hypothetical protein
MAYFIANSPYFWKIPPGKIVTGLVKVGTDSRRGSCRTSVWNEMSILPRRYFSWRCAKKRICPPGHFEELLDKMSKSQEVSGKALTFQGKAV